ncbi:MAG: class I SAM-dependent methyltransferase [Bacillota bacterium]|nr:class I SAM-dependent methyltransferase [Bacillota bacterium]
MGNLIQSTTTLAMHIVSPYIKPDSTIVDATCGNGRDTLALAKALFRDSNKASSVGCPLSAHRTTASTGDSRTSSGGRLYAFDIQQQAIDTSFSLLESNGFKPYINAASPNSCHCGSIVLIRDSHENMDLYIDKADLIVFNLGYLPGGDKTITTDSKSTTNAVRAALPLLEKDGLLCITMYSGHHAGAVEKAALLQLAEGLDPGIWHTAYINMINQTNDPPEILLITRKRAKDMSSLLSNHNNRVLNP